MLLSTPVSAEEKHQDEDTVLDDASLLRRRLEEVLRPKTEDAKTTKDEKEAEEEDTGVEIKSVPTSVSLLALTIGKGLTPKRLNDAIERLKKAKSDDEVELSQAARALAALLNLDPDEFRKKYEKLNGELDFEKIFEDLKLDGAEFGPQRTALKKALEEESQGPVQEEEEEEDPEENPEDGEEGVEDPSDPLDDFDDGSAFDPAEGALGDGLLDDALNNDDLALNDFDDDEEEILNDNEKIDDLIRDAIDKNNEKLNKNKDKNNNKNNKNAGNKNPGNPPPPEQPPQFPSIPPGQPGQGAKNPGIQPTKMPNPQPLPEFNPPTPIGDVPLGPDTVKALLGRGDSDKAAQRREDKVQQVLDAYQNLNQTAIQSILQIGARQAATIGAGPRSRTTTTGTPQGGGFSDRLRSFSSARGVPGQATGGSRSNGGPGLGLGSSRTQSSTPPPGYGVRKIR